MYSQANIPREYTTIEIQEVEEAISVKVDLPVEVADFSMIKTISQVNDAVAKLAPWVQKLARAAFVDGDRHSFDLIQKILYYWNYRDIKRKERLSGYGHLVEAALRQQILEIEKQSRNLSPISLFEDFTPEKAVKELQSKALSHRINTHPLLAEMAEHGLSKDEVRLFLENYYVNNRLFHLFIVTLSLFSPLERRTELANNFYDELGAGDGAMAHPVLFARNFDHIGLGSQIKPLPEAMHLANAKTYAGFLSGDYHYGMGGFGFIELTMPEQMKKILTGLEKSGLPREDLEFWHTHITIDERHGQAWFEEMLELIDTPEQALSCLQGGLYLLDARATMYDGILNAIKAEK